jgi:hypothetical protein
MKKLHAQMLAFHKIFLVLQIHFRIMTQTEQINFENPPTSRPLCMYLIHEKRVLFASPPN